MRNSKRFYEWLDYWRQVYYQPSVAASTYEINEFYVRIIKRWFPDLTLEKIRPLDCQQFLNRLHQEQYAKASIKKCITILNKAFSRAVTDKLIESSPMVNLTTPKAPTKKVSALTQKEQVAMETYCKNTLYGDFILFMLNTGLRVGEMIFPCGFHCAPVDFSIADSLFHASKAWAIKRNAGISVIHKRVAKLQLRMLSYVFFAY